jgi:hypothetical protein
VGVLDPAVRWVLFDTEEFLDFRAKKEYTPEHATRFRSLLQQYFWPVDAVGSVILFQRGTSETGVDLDWLTHVSPAEAANDHSNNDSMFVLTNTPTLNGSVLTVDVTITDPDKWRVLDESDRQQPLLRIVSDGEEIRVPVGYGFYAADMLQLGDVITTVIELPNRLLDTGENIHVSGLIVRPHGIVRGRYQSTVREDKIRSTFFEATIRAEE